MATNFQHRQLCRAVNSASDRYGLGQHVPVSSDYTAKLAEESRWLQWVVLGLKTNLIGTYPIDYVINGLLHPGVYFLTHHDNEKRHKTRLASVRHPPGTTHNLIRYDGIVIAAWIKPYLDDAKRRGDWRGFGISGDQATGWRGPVGQGLQAWLYKRYLSGVEPGPVAPPGTSRHEFCDCMWCRRKMGAKGGAVDVANAPNVANGDLRWAGDGDPPHCSSREAYNATGLY